ncbi:unnamed protein product [Caenorhabditis brenneri]
MPVTADELTTGNDQANTDAHKFVMKNIFKNVSKMKEDKDYHFTEDHFGLEWRICIRRQDGYLGVFFHHEWPLEANECPIDTGIEIHVFHPNGKSTSKNRSYCFKEDYCWGWGKFMRWETMEKEFLVNDELIVEYRVQIIKNAEMYKSNLRSFDNEECSDVTLVVDNRRFHVAKLYLSTHSSYFKSMFLSEFEESKKTEIKLTGVDSDDLQKYLEALYGEDAIDEMTVERILLLADMYDTKILVQKCEQFLLESSEKTSKEKLEMAGRYNLSELKEKCLSKIETIEDIRSALPECISRMDPSIMAVLFEKTLALFTFSDFLGTFT